MQTHPHEYANLSAHEKAQLFLDTADNRLYDTLNVMAWHEAYFTPMQQERLRIARELIESVKKELVISGS